VQIAGVDGCKGGWICITRDLISREISAEVVVSISSLLDRVPRPVVLAIDIPIGLPGMGRRRCEQLAREILGRPRASSVFPAPIRPALVASDREEADTITRSVDGRGVGAQAWGLYFRVREVDQLLTADAMARRFTYEVHPEVSFTAWNGGSAIVESKKSATGMAIRRRLVDSYFGEQACNTVRREQPRSLVADDDINDAFAALWTAARIYSGSARVIPNPPEIDSNGIAMGIWY
jgi:predicted RNase H-like nuclease